jgi:hypothetical protein
MPQDKSENEDERRVNRLTNIEPPIVSPVRRGANRGTFVLKSEEGDMLGEVQDQFGNPIIPAGDPPVPADVPTAPEPTAAEKANDISDAVKAKVVEALISVAERAKSLIGKVEALGTDEQAKGIPSLIGQEIKSMAAAMAGVLERYPSPQAAADGDAPDEDQPDQPDQDKADKGLLETAIEAVEKAAESPQISKKDLKGIYKLFVSFRKLVEQIDPDAKKKLKEMDIVLKAADDAPESADEALRAEVAKSTEAAKESAARFAALEKKLDAQSAHIAKMDRVVPEGNSDTDLVAPPTPASTEEEEFRFPHCPGDPKKD